MTETSVVVLLLMLFITILYIVTIVACNAEEMKRESRIRKDLIGADIELNAGPKRVCGVCVEANVRRIEYNGNGLYLVQGEKALRFKSAMQGKLFEIDSHNETDLLEVNIQDVLAIKKGNTSIVITGSQVSVTSNNELRYLGNNLSKALTQFSLILVVEKLESSSAASNINT